MNFIILQFDHQKLGGPGLMNVDFYHKDKVENNPTNNRTYEHQEHSKQNFLIVLETKNIVIARSLKLGN